MLRTRSSYLPNFRQSTYLTPSRLFHSPGGRGTARYFRIAGQFFAEQLSSQLSYGHFLLRFSALATACMARCTDERGIPDPAAMARTLRPSFIRSSTTTRRRTVSASVPGDVPGTVPLFSALMIGRRACRSVRMWPRSLSPSGLVPMALETLYDWGRLPVTDCGS